MLIHSHLCHNYLNSLVSRLISSSVLLQVIDFGDNIEFTPISGTEQDELSCNWDDIPLDSSNLVIKVPHIFLQVLATPQSACRQS